MRQRRLTLLLGALGASAALFVGSACGGSADNGGQAGSQAANQTITVNWGTEPPSLDPGLATDTTSANIVSNIMDPLVRLGEDLEPVPSLAESWTMSDGGKTITFKLRTDGKWTNGDPVKAGDFVYAWKRTLSPELGADYAYQLYGVVGAEDYNTCEKQCAALADKVGVTAVDDQTLRVQLTSAQPWFIQQVAHHAFLPVHKATIEKFGDKWTEPGNIVTNGPFKLVRWDHDSRIDIAKWSGWRNAADVKLQRVNGRMITDGTTAVQAFEAGEVDALITLPPEELPRLKGTPEYQQYPSLGTYYYGVNVKKITDVRQRRAMALAIDRRSIIDNVAQADQLPATGMTPEGMPGFDTINPSSPFLPENADLEQAKQLLSQVPTPVRNVTVFYNENPGHKAIATAIQSQWKELGLNVTIKAQEWAQFLEFLGPPANKSVDVYRLGWIGDFVDAINFLELWTCNSGNNNTGYCNPKYDSLIAQARNTQEDAKRYELYAQAEEMLFGPEGDMPILPIYWYTFTHLERENIKDTFNVDLLSQIDLTEVEVTES